MRGAKFLDIGTGLPGPTNVHDVAQGIDPTARILYVDNDPIVGVHARALLSGHPQGRTDYLEADLRRPGSILGSPALAGTLDLTQPVGVLLAAVLHFVPDSHEPEELVAQLLQPLVPGSFVVLSHGTADMWTDEQLASLPALTARDAAPYTPRSRADIERLVEGLDIVEPGVVSVAAWRDDQRAGQRPADHEVGCYGVVARKPGGLT